MAPLLFTFRLILYTTILLLVSFLAVFIGLVATLLGKRLNTNFYVARTFCTVGGFIMGWRFEVEGEEYLWSMKDVGGDPSVEGRAGETGRSAVMVGNHQSFVDILYIGRVMPKHAAIMAKKSLRWIPGLGWFMLLSGTVFINRGNNRSAVASLTQAGEDMKRKRVSASRISDRQPHLTRGQFHSSEADFPQISLWIFPEGTRYMSEDPDLLPFKKGAFYLAVQAGVPIVPVVCQTYHHLFDGKTRFRSGTLGIKVLPPMSTKGLTTADVPALAEKTRSLMLSALEDLSSTPISPTPLSQASSPTPLLASGDRRDGGYQSTSDDAPLQGAVAGSTASVDDAQSGKSRRYSIAMVSDFFHPVVGGVEGHIYSLGIELMSRGHRVIVITHHHPGRVGIRHLSGLKIYHLPILPIASSATLPNFLLFLPYLRNILLRERIDLVHAHGSLSSLGHEALYHAPLLGVRTVFTDHSLFGFGDVVGILTNKLLAGASRNVDAAICVSYTGRENTVLRAQLEPEIVSVIPNALVADQFTPDPSRASSDHITIVVISRLVYRKGIDLLVASAPQICDLFPDVRFVVGGDGPKMVDLEQMREKYQLQDRIELLGSVRPSDVRDVLTRGQIYLNTSLTESFGISIIEAACAGLFVVSTKVGGVPEILPGEMIEFARADEDDVTRALSAAIRTVRSGKHDPLKAHERVRGMYSWSDVTGRTEVVYERAMTSLPRDSFERLSRLISLGPVFGPILCGIIAVQHWFFLFLEAVQPRDEIDLIEGVSSKERFVKECAMKKAVRS